LDEGCEFRSGRQAEKGQEAYVHKDALERIREQSMEETTRTKTVDQMWADLLAANADGR
jgi:hypothetical protein